MDQRKKDLTRIGMIILGNIIYALSVNLVITPVHLYSGGFTGIAQLIRLFLLEFLKIPQIPGFDYMGVIYYLINVPLFIMAYRIMGRKFCLSTMAVIAVCSAFLAVVPVPPAPIIEDTLLSAVIGGIGWGFAAGIVLRAGSSQGGQDVIGVCLAKTHPDFKVGTIGIAISALIYGVCLFVYDIETVLYSMIFAVAAGMTIDRVHTQNIKIQCMIFTKEEGLADAILSELRRGVTTWEGAGAYTRDGEHILVTVISKYEEHHLREIIARKDPHAFMTITDNTRVIGNFEKRFTE